MKRDSASIIKWGCCKDCGWPVIHCCCNDEMAILHPESDWWGYCSNQGCKNHKGEDWYWDEPEWIKHESFEGDEIIINTIIEAASKLNILSSDVRIDFSKIDGNGNEDLFVINVEMVASHKR